MNRLNKFTQFIEDGDCTILFNLQTETVLILKSDLARIVNEHKDSVDDLEALHPELYREMQQKSFLVPVGTDEVQTLVEGWQAADRDPRSFSMIVNPTLGCNLRCWYCYEEHDRMPLMKPDVLASICRLLERKAADPALRRLNVSFFGGEPLLGFQDVVMPLLTLAGRLSRERNLALTSNFTTNGVLLTDEKLDALEAVGLTDPATFQISLDGNKDYHDRSRVGVNQAPTYDIIVRHMVRAARRGHPVFARLNYTAGNAATFLDVLDDFRDQPQEVKNRIQFNFQQIWQDQANDIRERIDELKTHFRAAGFQVDSDRVSNRHYCYADHENHVVVNYDGNLFKCTARDFRPVNREGQLTEDGDLVWNERYAARMAVKYTNKACLACKILPLCNGGCTQNKLESAVRDACYKGMDEAAKDEQILRRLKEVLTLQHT